MAHPTRRPVIVKLGGSLLTLGRAKPWLDALAGQPQPVVIVPGGGPFADQVRNLQRPLGFDDRAAHHMAVLAMAQTACVLQSWCTRWQLGPTVPALQALTDQGHPALWCPTVLPDTPASWDITSDSLAAWLAAELHATQLVLVKSRAAQSDVPADWVSDRLADAAFVDYAQRFDGVVRLVSHDTEPLAALAA